MHKLKNCCGIIYSNNYNITACGIEKMHPFDSTKYERVYNALLQN